MVTIDDARALAMAYDEVIEQDHFGMPSFRIRKKIFATIHARHNRMMLKLPAVEQSVFCAYDPAIVYPVPGFWGKQGATFFDLKKVRKSMLRDAMTVAYSSVAPKTLAAKYKPSV